MKRTLLAILVLGSISLEVAGRPVEPRRSESVRSLSVLPETIVLVGPHSAQRLVVLARTDSDRLVDVTHRARIEPLDPQVIEIGEIDVEARPAVLPRDDGRTQLRVTLDTISVDVSVEVRAFDDAPAPRFADDVLAHMTRASCNSGACHGSQHGRGGLKLSLLGYEPADDYLAVVRDAFSRRIDRLHPERSALLAKPLGHWPHEGGRRLESGSRAHRSILRWIDAGTPAPRVDAPALAGIEVAPRSVFEPGSEPAHFLVTAIFADGHREDVTGRALLESLNDGLAKVDGAGRVTTSAGGETAIMVRYRGSVDVLRVTVPFPEPEAEDAIPNVEASEAPPFVARDRVDELLAAKWKRLGLVPSRQASDGELMRRIYLAAIGTLPSAEEVRAFLDDDRPDRVDRLVDAVLERPEYADYWSLRWGDILRVDRGTMDEKGMWSLANWIRTQMRENRPLDAFVRDLLTAQGSTYTHGPANYFRVSRRPQDLAETTAQAFLGLRLQCAQCHHHPFERWTQDDYWGLAAYFSRLGIKSSSEFGVYGREQAVYVKTSGEVRHPRNGRVVAPSPLGSAGDGTSDPIDRRRDLARWLTSPENRLFARSVVNRFWGQMLGRGLVEPVDDLRATNPATVPEVLEELADGFVASGFDQKALIRRLLRTRVFRLSSLPRPGNVQDETLHSRYLIRRLPAEILHDALCDLTGVPESFSGLPAGSRAIQLPDPKFSSYFLDTFGKPKRASACECDRETKPNLAQALHLIVGDFLGTRLGSADGRIARRLAENANDDAIIEDFYLAAFARRPQPEELEVARQHIAAASTRREGLEDLLWALSSATEFLFQH